MLGVIVVFMFQFELACAEPCAESPSRNFKCQCTGTSGGSLKTVEKFSKRIQTPMDKAFTSLMHMNLRAASLQKPFCPSTTCQLMLTLMGN